LTPFRLWKFPFYASDYNSSTKGILMSRFGIRDGSPVLHEFRPFIPGFFSLLFLSLFVTLLFISTPLYIEQVQDRVMTGRNVTTLLVLTGIVLFLLFCKSMLETVRLTSLQRMSVAFDDRLNHVVFHQVNRAQTQRSVSAPAQILSDISTVRETLGSKLVSSMMDVVWSPIYLVILYLLHPIYAFIAILLVLLHTGFTIGNAIAVKSAANRHQEASQKANNFGNAVLREAENLRVLGMVPRIRDRWQAHHRAQLGWGQTIQDINNRFGTATGFLRNSQHVMMQAVGALLFLNNQVSPASFIAASIIVSRCIGPIDHLISSWSRVTQAQQAIQRLDDFLQSESDTARKITLPKPFGQLQVNRITLIPPGAEKVVLHEVSFALGAGRILGIAGSSGAGKSCLARALVGMWLPARGSVALGKHDLAHWNADELGEHLGYMPQDIVLLPGTIAENIARFDPDHDGRDARLLGACDLASINDLVQSFPDGLNTKVGESGSHVLSGGQRQRIALARAVYGVPRLVVLDEPNSNLDATGEQSLFQAIHDLKAAGSTVVVVSHKISLLNYCDDILVLNEGAVQAFGTRQEVFASISRLKPAQISTQSA
jgi:PrtD family type I secretion system ABC transporter